ncbi:MAG: arginine--tRNA ligase [Pirellulaceae bacterium]
MNILSEIRSRFRPVLAELVDDPSDLLEMIRPSQDAKFGDYQANCAMPLKNRLGGSPRDIAARIVAGLKLDDMCEPPEIAGPGFINLRLKTDWLVATLGRAVRDERLGVAAADPPRTMVIDYSSPNVAKPMHVGHIRSTVIGDALCRTLRFLGHQVVSDNHLGDWGTQFGMIIYGYKHFVDREAYARRPVPELSRLYKLVNQLIEYHDSRQKLPELEQRLEQTQATLAEQQSAAANANAAEAKKAKKELRSLEKQMDETRDELHSAHTKVARVEQDERLLSLANEHIDIAAAVLRETAKLHEGDAENLALWHEFLPNGRDEIQSIYDRLDIRFDVEYGESYYHEALAGVVESFESRGLARPSDGATCVFLDGFKAPMIIRKQDGAFLYATTDLATIQYRMQTWAPAAILYVVDHRQSEHFDKLFAAARLWGYEGVEFRHVSFGTVLGEDGRPFKTRSGESVSLETLLDEAVAKAHRVVCDADDAKKGGPELDESQRREVADAVGIGALKYADLSQNRTSDYVFSYEKMLAMNGNTGAYMQYSYARVQGIFGKGGVDVAALRNSGGPVLLAEPEERALAVYLTRFSEALAETVADYRPNQLTNYVYELTKLYFSFYEKCPVLKADSDELRTSRLLLSDLTARTIRQSLELLGIRVVDRM